MKKDAYGTMDPARVALLLELSLGLGIVVHEGFFLVAGAIAMGSLAVAAVHGLREHSEASRLTQQHR